MNATASHSELALLATDLGNGRATGPSFTAALCGFLGTTLATTMVMFLLSSL